ncbi:hypothetical protein D3C87_677720 [compost metagenome]
MNPVKQNRNPFLKMRPAGFLMISLLFILVMVLLVFSQRAGLNVVNVVRPDGNSGRANKGFNTPPDKLKGIYIYSVSIHNTILFKEKVQIIPKGCILEVYLNKLPLPRQSFQERRCDDKNGFLIDLQGQLWKGENQLEVMVQSTNGSANISLIDLTFYEKFVVLGYILFVCCFLRLKSLGKYFCQRVLDFYRKKRVLVKTSLLQSALFILTLIATGVLIPSPVLFPLVIIQLLLLIIFPLTYFIYHNFSGGKILSLVWIAMVITNATSLFLIHHSSFSYDFRGHIDYVRYICDYGEIPIPSGGWSFYHPSFYYRLAAGLWKLVNIGKEFTDADFTKTIQVFSFITFMVYCYWSLKTIELSVSLACKRNRITAPGTIVWVKLLTSAVFLFWASNFVVSIRVGNDIFFNLFYAITFYFILKWWNKEKGRDFFFAMLFSVLCIWSKSNGFMLLGLVALLLGCKYLRRYLKPNLIEKQVVRTYHYKVLLLAFASVMCLHYTFTDRILRQKNDRQTPILVSNANGMSKDLIVENGWNSFTSFDISRFINEPFTSSYDNQKGRNSFWYYLIKTSLFGEFSYDFPQLARILSLLLIAICIISIAGYSGAFNYRGTLLPLALSLSIMLCSMVVFRIFYPYSSSSDFRYIFPSVLPLTIFMGIILLRIRTWSLLYYLISGLCVGFAILSISFQILVIASLS